MNRDTMTTDLEPADFRALSDPLIDLCPPVRSMAVAGGIRLEYRMRNGDKYGFVVVKENGWQISAFPMSDSAFQALAMVASGWERVVGRRLWNLADFPSRAQISEVATQSAILIAEARGRLDMLLRGPEQPDSLACYYGGFLNANFGDMLAPFLIQKILGHPVHQSMHEPKGHAYVSVGSVLNNLTRGGMVIWGSGCIRALTDGEITRLADRPPESVLAVRGYRTRAELDRLPSWPVSDRLVLGDPAMVLPLVHPVSVTHDDPPLLVLHYMHKPLFEGIESTIGLQVMSTDEVGPREAIKRISSASVVISTSLHGIVVAQAYHRPWLWLDISDHALIGGDFKFYDFGSVLAEDIDRLRYRTTSKELRSVSWSQLICQARRPNDTVRPDVLIDALVCYAAARGDCDEQVIRR